MKYAALFVLAAGLATSALAQRAEPWNAPHALDLGSNATTATPDTTTPWRYFPMHTGDVWEYENGPYLHRFYIDRDTLIGALHYFKQVREFYNQDGVRSAYIFREYLRYDSTNHTVRSKHPVSDGERSFFPALCPFDSDFDVSIECDFSTHRVTGRYRGTLVFGEGAGRGRDTVRTSVKVFSDGAQEYGYAAGIGLAYWDVEGVAALSYYRVGGVERGRKRIVVTADPAEAPGAAALTVEAIYPNPFRDRFSLRLLRSPLQEAQVEVFDALGRRVLMKVVRAGSAVETVEMEGGTLAPGVYFVRATSDAGTARTITLTRLN